jgi:hypothetical protein
MFQQCPVPSIRPPPNLELESSVRRKRYTIVLFFKCKAETSSSGDPKLQFARDYQMQTSSLSNETTVGGFPMFLVAAGGMQHPWHSMFLPNTLSGCQD